VEASLFYGIIYDSAFLKSVVVEIFFKFDQIYVPFVINMLHTKFGKNWSSGYQVKIFN
jgi:hypothetical protein